jgi:hypothetical protein
LEKRFSELEGSTAMDDETGYTGCLPDFWLMALGVQIFTLCPSRKGLRKQTPLERTDLKFGFDCAEFYTPWKFHKRRLNRKVDKPFPPNSVFTK